MIGKKRHHLMLFALPILLFSIVLCSCKAPCPREISKSYFVLNTFATITVFCENDEKIIDECFNICRYYENLFSRTDKNSEIYKLNHREITVVSDETAELIKKGLYYSELSGGSFDITVEPLSSLWDFSSDSPSVPAQAAIDEAKSAVDYKSVSVDGNSVTFSNGRTRLDLGAVAKGYIADKLRSYLVSQGVKSAIINLGGNVLCIGGKTDYEGFEVGIQRPFGEGAIAGVTVSDMSVVTSGTYERFFKENGKCYHHLLDPRSGYPYNNGLLSVTIIGASSSDCDALSTACFALGLEDGAALINGIEDVYAVFITEDYKLHFSEGAESCLKIKY